MSEGIDQSKEHYTALQFKGDMNHRWVDYFEGNMPFDYLFVLPQLLPSSVCTYLYKKFNDDRLN